MQPNEEHIMINIFEILNTMFKGKKTYYLAIATVLGTVSAYLHGGITLMEAIEPILLALFGTTLRSGINTVSEKK